MEVTNQNQKNLGSKTSQILLFIRASDEQDQKVSLLSLIHIQMCIRDRRYYDQVLLSIDMYVGSSPLATMQTCDLLLIVYTRIITKSVNLSVSYTHLDVYKRQNTNREVSAPIQLFIFASLAQLVEQQLSLIHIQMCIRDRRSRPRLIDNSLS